MYARTPTVRQSPCRLLAPSTAMACRMLLAGNRGAYKSEFAMVRTSLAKAGSEEIRSLNSCSCTFSLLASCRTRRATWGKGGRRRCAQVTLSTSGRCLSICAIKVSPGPGMVAANAAAWPIFPAWHRSRRRFASAFPITGISAGMLLFMNGNSGRGRASANASASRADAGPKME